MRTRLFLLFLLICAAPTRPAPAENLPERLAPAAPFPSVLSESFERDEIAPGVGFGRYYMMTAAGPLVVHALSITPNAPGVRIEAVLAEDRLVSKGETVSSMAARTGAIAGINADFFDIGNTYHPLGILVHAGLLLHQAGEPASLVVTKSHEVQLDRLCLCENDSLPADVETAVGGGPQLIRDGVPYDDPLPPAPGEALKRNPLSGALRQKDGTLVLVQVDGRAPGISIGVTRPELTALLRAFDAIDAMGFDGGGSSTIVARLPGDRAVSLQNTPSDGRERPVSDGLFIYSDAPVGPPAHLAVHPSTIRALTGAVIPLAINVIDAAGHPLMLPAFPVRAEVVPATLASLTPDRRLIAGNIAGSGIMRLRNDAGTLTANVNIEITDRVAHVRIEPEHPNPRANESLALRALAFNEAGAPISVEGRVAWQARGGGISADGLYRAGAGDGVVTARIAGQEAATIVRVGRRELPIDAFRHNGPAAQAWSFSSAPAGGPGSAEIDSDDVLALSYDFTGNERAAYADANLALDGMLTELRVDLQGDGSGVAARVLFTNPDGDRIPVTLAAHVDWQGWRTLRVKLPRAALDAQTIAGFYVVAPRGGTAESGTIALRNLRGTFAGTSTPIPPYHVVHTPSPSPPDS